MVNPLFRLGHFQELFLCLPENRCNASFHPVPQYEMPPRKPGLALDLLTLRAHVGCIYCWGDGFILDANTQVLLGASHLVSGL